MYVSLVNDDCGLLSGRWGLTGSCRCDCITSHLQVFGGLVGALPGSLSSPTLVEEQ